MWIPHYLCNESILFFCWAWASVLRLVIFYVWSHCKQKIMLKKYSLIEANNKLHEVKRKTSLLNAESNNENHHSMNVNLSVDWKRVYSYSRGLSSQWRRKVWIYFYLNAGAASQSIPNRQSKVEGPYTRFRLAVNAIYNLTNENPGVN